VFGYLAARDATHRAKEPQRPAARAQREAVAA